MNYVEKLNLFGVEAKEIPCIKGEGAPSTTTEGAVGSLYMDTKTGTTYKCIAVSGNNYTWVLDSNLNYITPDMYGAKGDGVTDDTEAFQACFDASQGKTIVIPYKKYLLRNAIKLRQEIFNYDIRGEGGLTFPNKSGFVPDNEPKNKIICISHFLDGSSDDGYIQRFSVNIRDIFVSFGYDQENKDFLHNILVHSASIVNCTLESPNCFLKGGLAGRSLVDNCKCFTVMKSFIEDGDFATEDDYKGITDAVISNCYVNGGGSNGFNASLFKVSTFTTTIIKDCYFDFFKEGFVRYATARGVFFSNVKVIGCIFDIFWRVVTIALNGDTPLVFDGCHFTNISENRLKTYFSSPDSEMLSNGVYTKCGVLVNDMTNDFSAMPDNKHCNLKNVHFVNNTFRVVDYPIYLASNAYGHKEIKEYGSYFYNTKENVVIDFVSTESDTKTWYFEALNDKEYSTLPVIKATSQSSGNKLNITWFEGMRIFYNGKPAILHNCKWIDYMGNELT